MRLLAQLGDSAAALRLSGVTRRVRVDERGATMVFLLITLGVLLLFAGLAIDVPIAMNERRTAQNAADHAALSAAYAECTGADAVSAANASVVNNGYDIAALTLTDLGGGEYEATVQATSETYFTGAIGLDTFAVSTTARAECTASGGSGYAIFAIGDTCERQIDIPGSNQMVYGGVHSNRNIHVGGDTNDLGGGNGDPPVDPVTRVVINPDGGKTPDYDAGYPLLTTYTSAPISYDIAHYRPGGAAATAAAAVGEYFDFTGSPITGTEVQANGDGLYYTDDKIDIGDSNLTYTLTLVSEYDDDGIKISGSNQDLDPYVDGLLAFSTMNHADNDDKCSKFSVAMSGSSNAWSGIVYAPDGMIEMSGSSNSTLSGSLIGYTVRVNGSNVNIQADPSLYPGDPVTRITQ